MKVLSCLVATCVVAGALAASSAGAGLRASHASIVCPGRAGASCCPTVLSAAVAAPSGRPMVVCCPVVTPTGCCSPVATPCCATQCTSPGMSLRITPDPATEGGATTITGALTGTSVSGQAVTLWRRLAGESAFHQVASTQTDSSGGFTFTQSVRLNADWYAKAGSVTSTVVHESVLAAVSLHASSLHPRLGARVRLAGSVAPSHAGEPVALELRRGARWVTVARPRLTASSRFAVTWRIRTRATVRFRVVLGADARNARSVSASVAVKAF